MLVLPTSTVPAELTLCIQANSTPVRRMLNGYRNKLTTAKKLVLVKHDDFCGQAMCINLLDVENEELNKKLLAFETEEQKMEQVGNNFVLLCKDQVTLYDGSDKMSQEQLNSVLEKLGDKDRADVARNLMLGMFDSLEQLQNSGMAGILLENKESGSVVRGKENKDLKFEGKNLFFVPQLDKKTGEWTVQHAHPLKIQITQKVPNKNPVPTQGQPSNEAEIREEQC